MPWRSSTTTTGGIPGSWRSQLAVLDARPAVGLVSCYSALVDADGLMLGWRLGGDADGRAYAEMLERDLVSGGSVAMVRRSALLETGGFDETLPMRSDWDLWIRLGSPPRGRHREGDARRLHPQPRRALGRAGANGGRAGEQVLAKARTADASIDDQRFRFLRARDSFAIACFCLFDEHAAEAWAYLRRSTALNAAPVLRSPRRWAIVGAIVLLTMLPRRAYAAVLGLACRSFFGLRAGARFEAL